MPPTYAECVRYIPFSAEPISYAMTYEQYSNNHKETSGSFASASQVSYSSSAP